jgi:hypothetical protein
MQPKVVGSSDVMRRGDNLSRPPANGKAILDEANVLPRVSGKAILKTAPSPIGIIGSATFINRV